MLKVLFGIIVVFAATVVVLVLVSKLFPRCVRCTQRMWKNKLMPFHGVHMCEPCENIASYYWDQQ